ncbi:Spy/CpxP family protein refolding chaperone [Negadavirga shengliensis]|uniref:Spy/CpxP family protein refolding chaperone n=1 Tax=Negadavirga shengliensis TaxID=1389218 RepID=A0ABV9T693_9BACT
MKNFLILILFIGTLIPAMAQRGKNVDREKLEAARVAFITNRLSLSPEQAEKFWPVYNQHHETRRKLMHQMHDLARSAADSLTDSQAQNLIKRQFEIKEQLLEEEKRLMDKVSSMLTPVHAYKLTEANREFTRQLYRMQRRGGPPPAGRND